MPHSPPSQHPDESVSELRHLIRERILADPNRRISFAEYMELALYHPDYGYYSAGPKIGASGDFVTSPYLGADFGELFAEQLVDFWHQLERPNPFTLVEMGAGHGLLVQDILTYLQQHDPACWATVDYKIVEKSPALIALQQRRLQAWQTDARLQWLTWEAIAPNSLVGCCFSNELVDAFPVHQVIMQDGQLQEVYVSVSETQDLIEVTGDLSTPRIIDYFQTVGIDIQSPAYESGYRTEVNLAMLDWLKTIAERLQRGYILTIDYGHPASRYYNPRRSHGTLQCYYRHAHHSDPYLHVGRQDITAHVDFTALERQGEHLGLKTEGFTTQGLWLMALGLGDRIAALSDPDAGLSISTVLQRREALHGLIDPMGLGNFGVLIQSKGVTTTETPKGLIVPAWS